MYLWVKFGTSRTSWTMTAQAVICVTVMVPGSQWAAQPPQTGDTLAESGWEVDEAHPSQLAVRRQCGRLAPWPGEGRVRHRAGTSADRHNQPEPTLWPQTADILGECGSEVGASVTGDPLPTLWAPAPAAQRGRYRVRRPEPPDRLGVSRRPRTDRRRGIKGQRQPRQLLPPLRRSKPPALVAVCIQTNSYIK